MSNTNHIWREPTEEGQEKIKLLRDKFIELDDFIDEIIGDHPTPIGARNKSLAKTYLEDSRMRAIFAVAHENSFSDIQPE